MWKSLLIAALAIANCQAVLETDANTLILLDNLAIRETHSLFFKSLQGRERKRRLTSDVDNMPERGRFIEISYILILLYQIVALS